MVDLTTIEADLATAEAQVPQLRPGCEKRIVWADAPARKSKIAIVFIHGFSATGEELRPLPDLVAEGLDANLYFTRLTGHGQDGAAMGRATLADWQRDTDEAIAVAEALGDQVIIMGCSTGCTLATLALAMGAKAHGVVHISPNFGLTSRLGQFLLDLPFARHWAKYLAGNQRSFPAISEAHEKYWTIRYPTAAVHTMADAVAAVRNADLSAITAPALFCFNEADQVVHPAQTRKVIARWGGPTTTHKLTQAPQDDKMGHIMAGDVFSPGQTLPLAQQILAWSATLRAT